MTDDLFAKLAQERSFQPHFALLYTASSILHKVSLYYTDPQNKQCIYESNG